MTGCIVWASSGAEILSELRNVKLSGEKDCSVLMLGYFPESGKTILKSSFTEKYFTYHTIYSLKVYNSVGFNMIKGLYNHHPKLILQPFHPLLKKPLANTSHCVLPMSTTFYGKRFASSGHFT